MPADPARPAMVKRTLFIVRGAPGSGKSRLARIIAPGACYSADDYFETLAMEYAKTYEEVWKAEKLGAAHDECFDRVHGAMAARCNRISVHNTFIKRSEIQRYRELATERGYELNVIRMESNFGNVHKVPVGKVDKMRRELEAWEC